MFITERKFGILKIVNVYFAEKPGTADISDYDVVTYHTFQNWGTIKGIDRAHYFTTTIDLSQNLGDIWNKIKRQHRRHIRRAEKNGTIVTVSDDYKKFHQIHKNFVKQKKYAGLAGIKILPLEFIQKYGTLFIAENQGEPLGGNLYFHDDHNTLLVCHAYKQPGNSVESNKQIADANCLIHWKAMEYFKNLKVINYDLGGLGSNEIHINNQMHGLDYFKRSFGGNVISHYEYRKFKSHFNKSLFSSLEYLRNCI
jgi:hypothetical protein